MPADERDGEECKKSFHTERFLRSKSEHEIPDRFYKYVRPEREFVELLKECAFLNSFGKKVDWDSFDVVTASLEDIIDHGRPMRREITSNDVNSIFLNNGSMKTFKYIFDVQ